MDIIIRVVLMMVITIFLPVIADIVGELSYKKTKIRKENIIEKIGYFIIVFLYNWFIIVPAIVFFECFKYIFVR